MIKTTNICLSYSIKPTVLLYCKYEFCARKTTQSLYEHCSLRKKKSGKYCCWSSGHWHFTYAIHKRCNHKLISQQSCRENPARKHKYRFRNLWVLPFPLKVKTNNTQLALVKWNNVFFYTIHTKIKNLICSNDSIFSNFLVSISVLHRGSGYLGKG